MPNIAAYCSGVLGPGQIDAHITDIQDSGIDTVILWSLHIGRTEIPGQHYGDLIFNDGVDTFVSQGAFNPNGRGDIAAWPGQIAALEQGNSKVSKVYFSIGGDDRFVKDFRSIEYMLDNGMEGQLRANFAALREAFTVDGKCVIDGIDLDNEEAVKDTTITDFSKMLFELGFEVTFCPFSGPDVWAGYMATLWKQGYEVSRWNLQAYSGGSGNLDPSALQSWIDAIDGVTGKGTGAGYLVPGLAVMGATDSSPQQCPTGSNGMCGSFLPVHDKGLLGGFVWKYDSVVGNTQPCGAAVPSLADYVRAITDGLSGKCP